MKSLAFLICSFNYFTHKPEINGPGNYKGMEVEKTRKKIFHTNLDKYASRSVLCFNGPARELTGERHQDFWPRVITSPRDVATLQSTALFYALVRLKMPQREAEGKNNTNAE